MVPYLHIVGYPVRYLLVSSVWTRTSRFYLKFISNFDAVSNGAEIVYKFPTRNNAIFNNKVYTLEFPLRIQIN
jgi:hypothetical protein